MPDTSGLSFAVAVAQREDSQWQAKLAKLIAAKGGAMEPADFHRLVNVVFHDVEAAVYDRVHQEMWKSLRPVISQLADDAVTGMRIESGLVLADVGCGTGLASTFLLETSLGNRIERLELVDTSTEMLARCRQRESSWRRPATFRNGGIEDLADRSVDVIVASSVLHHMPDLQSFCSHVDRVLRQGGAFVHLQDPRTGNDRDPALQERTRELQQRGAVAFWAHWPRILRLPFSAWNRVVEWRASGYLREVNRRLLRAGAIRYPMTSGEIWSVTDIHVEGLPYAIGDGISRDGLQRDLPGFTNRSWRSYSFFGQLPSSLPAEFVERERQLFQQRDPSGANVAGVWMKS